MNILTNQFSVLNLVISLSNVLDRLHPEINQHHLRVSYIALNIANSLGYSDEDKKELLLASSLHDIGILTLKDKLSVLEYDYLDIDKHALRGYLFLQGFDILNKVAQIILHHHTNWEDIGEQKDNKLLCLSNIIYLADRIDSIISKKEDILLQKNDILEKISNDNQKKYNPLFIEAFKDVSSSDAFWLELEYPDIEENLLDKIHSIHTEYSLEDINKLAVLFSQLIDFRSRFTATHSSGVASVAEVLCYLCGYSEEECKITKIGGYFHDIGKLIVPNEILEKNGKLTPEEFSIIKRHPFYSYKLLKKIKPLKEIAFYAASHHERLNGTGYPFGLKGEEIPHLARIMAVADVFTAITEDRPYRKGMSSEGVIKVLRGMVKASILDGEIVELLEDNFREVQIIREKAQTQAFERFERFYAKIEGL